jgi:hypothetical protein
METHADKPRDPPDTERAGVSRRAVLLGGAGVAAAAAGAAGYMGLRERRPSDTLTAAFLDGALPVTDPSHDAWGDARVAEVALQPQQMATPWLHEQTLERLRVRALFNGSDLGLLLEWDDDAPSEHDGIATFKDAAAVMMPARPGGEEPPPIFMGWEGQPVYIAQWRASWQADLDRGFQDVGDVYPGWYSDMHPDHDTLRGLGLSDDRASVYAPGRHVGNALSQQERSSPVEELSAEGFGTLTHLADQRAQGRGLHEDGRWGVAIGIAAGGNAPALAAGQALPVSFAIWHGEHGQVGARKQYADWTELTLPGS